ncbi:MAG: TIGR03620 family F420-dependent LLM class oxidoreductase [Steroidobacteraceae bacterium]
MQAMQLGKLGVWAFTDTMTAPAAAAFAARVERWGYSTLWIPEAFGRNPLPFAAWLLARTDKLIVATGIASIYARDPLAMRSAQLSLAEQSSGRFLLGLGVSHARMVEQVRGHPYDPKPVSRMRGYLEQMAQVQYRAPAPAERPPIVLAALGPKMLELSGRMADGAHPYNVTPEHTAEARRILGPGKWLCTEQKVLLESDPAKARSIARQAVGFYLTAPNYANNLRRLGFDDTDLAGDGSDRLIDALVAWGGIDAIRARIQEHWDAGADQVCIQALNPDPAKARLPHEEALERLAPLRGSAPGSDPRRWR